MASDANANANAITSSISTSKHIPSPSLPKFLHPLYRLLSYAPILKNFTPPGYSNAQALSRTIGSFLFTSLIAYLMAIFGDGTAWYGMPKFPEEAQEVPIFRDSASPHALPDLGFKLIPFWCPLQSPQNIQTVVLTIFLGFIFVRSIFHPHGRLILQRTWHLTATIYFCRWLCVALTYMPNPNPQCFWAETNVVTLFEVSVLVLWLDF